MLYIFFSHNNLNLVDISIFIVFALQFVLQDTVYTALITFLYLVSIKF